jgi:hypothetical protein
MSEEILEERELGIEEYLQLFSDSSTDYQIVKDRSEKLKAIYLKKLRGADGVLYEDTTFVEKTGVTYTIRVKL